MLWRIPRLSSLTPLMILMQSFNFLRIYYSQSMTNEKSKSPSPSSTYVPHRRNAVAPSSYVETAAKTARMSLRKNAISPKTAASVRMPRESLTSVGMYERMLFPVLGKSPSTSPKTSPVYNRVRRNAMGQHDIVSTVIAESVKPKTPKDGGKKKAVSSKKNARK